MKIVKSLEESSLLIKDVSETIINEVKEQTGGFLSMLLGALGASLLGNLLKDKERWQQVKDEIQLERVKAILEQVRIFNAGSSFKKF